MHLSTLIIRHHTLIFFFFNDTATTEIYTLSLHDALPIWMPITPIARPSGSRRASLRPRKSPGALLCSGHPFFPPFLHLGSDGPGLLNLSPILTREGLARENGGPVSHDLRC